MAPWYQKVFSALVLTTPIPLACPQETTPTPTSSATSSQFTVPPDADEGAPLLPNVLDPDAVNAQDVCPGYQASAVEELSNGIKAHLSLDGEACNVYGNEVQELELLVEYQANSRLHINIRPSHVTPENQSWYLLRTEYVPAPSQGDGTIETSELVFGWTNDPSFGFNVTRKADSDVLFSTVGHKLVFEDQFVEFVTDMEESYNVYGLGEVMHGLRLGNNLTRTIYAADAGDPIDGNIYGSHPFYLQTKYYEETDDGSNNLVTEEIQSNETSGTYESTSHGVYLRNAHGMEVLMNPTNITWRTLGGSIDLYFFAGPTQPEVTKQYLTEIGLPVMQQYWTFGFHQCRWGYANWSQTEEVVDSYSSFGIPLEVIWNDIDYMTGYRDFTNDEIRFNVSEGQAFLQRLHDRGQHYVPIIDAAIYIPNPDNESDAYNTFDRGNETGSFLLNPDGSTYIGAVWPGYTVFADWHTDAAKEWWIDEMVRWHSQIPFDGAWIDMNEVSSFCVGSCGSNNLSLNPVHPSFKLNGESGAIVYDYPEGFNLTNATEAASASAGSSSQAASMSSTAATSSTTSYLRTTPTPGIRNVVNPPYVINNIQGALDVHAVSPNATHHSGTLEYDVHNLYGHQTIQETYRALSKIFPGKRPFIIGRSNFVGSGNYSGHWGGDNASKFYYMYFSIPQALSFSLFGIPMFGVDTCGFNGNSDEELCNRWMQLSALFPFYRNHNTLATISQEAYVWSSVADATKKAMDVRFQLLPYMYTLFYHAHTRADTVMRALAWEFPNDPSLANADRQFFLGPSILVTPCLVQGATTVDGVFPGLFEGTDTYYDWYDHSPIPVPDQKNTTIDAPLGHIPVYIRGGSVLATQAMAMTTRDARNTSWSIIVALDMNGSAQGTLYLDDGVSVEPATTKLVTFSAAAGQLNVTVQGDYNELDLPLANITILGLKENPQDDSIQLNGNRVTQSTYDSEKQRLSIEDIEGAVGEQAWGSDWNVSWL